MKISKMIVSALFCLAAIRMLPASDLSLDVETGNALHLVYDASSPVSAVVSNTSSLAQAVGGRLEVRDRKGRGFAIPVSGTLPPDGVARYPLPGPLPAKGFYRIRLLGDKADKPVASTSFAFVERHKVTPLLSKPKFRFGFTDHPLYYASEERHLLFDAFVASGAKLARVGLAGFGDVLSGGDGCFDWRESDEGIEAFRSRGISLNAMIYGAVPRWAAESNRVANCIRDKVEWAIGCMPPREGLFRDYCRVLAARYGTKIDYYEIGNEFDMVPRWILPPEVALRLQREAWEGIKESCPTACVITCGWAVGGSEDYFHNGKRLPNLGIMEEFLEKGQGWFDVLPVHLHGSFENYETRLSSKFFPLLKRYGVKQPWYSNETADHISGGREVPVAIDVWRKILYAWAHGSIDYTWYNLRAKAGRAGAGVEWAYGVMTHDWHPMPAFASFSALAAIFNGLDFECAHADGDELKVYRFKGGDRVVLAGWTAGGENSAVHLATDAHGAELYDVMGQRMPLAIEDGKLRWNVTEEPSALVLSAATQVKVESAPLKFLSFNIWGDYFKNPVTERETGIEASILKYRPEVVSLQEVTPNWYKSQMFTNLGKHGYDLVRGDEEAALSRAAFTGKKTAEHINHEPLLYRRDRLKLLDSGTEFFHLALQTSKSVTWAVLEDRTSGRRFAAFATHFWWQNNGKESDTIRELNARHVLWLLADIRRKWGEALPAILGGDLNSVEKSLAHEMLRRGGFFNAASHADVRSPHCSHHGDPKRGADGKYHGSLRPAKDDTPDRSIDHIYYTKGIHALRHEIGTDQQALDATDHSPVLVEFTVER